MVISVVKKGRFLVVIRVVTRKAVLGGSLV